MKTLILLIIALTVLGCQQPREKFVQENFEFAMYQTRGMLEVATDHHQYPRTTAKDGSLKTTDRYDWTSGFFPGNLWLIYEHSQDPFWKTEAIKWTETLEPLQYFTNHHDLGFMMYCSYGRAYAMTGKPEYKDILIQSAYSLASRFDERTGAIKSWNYRRSWDGQDEWFYPVIIDNMMNLELLFFAFKETGDSALYNVAITHTETTIKNHFRPDFSTYHVVNYDTISGKALHRATMQGYADESTWARGQAWAVYGFTMVFRETNNPLYLEVAKKAANLYLDHYNLPEDKVPYWDFDANNPSFYPDWSYNNEFSLELRDASAAAIMASALLELSKYATTDYYTAAETILHNLTHKYRADKGTNNNFILKHSVGSIPHKEEINVPLVYADYYFLEALQRYLTY
jgi:unsaturated chondroitin disaccharide hydrolase